MCRAIIAPLLAAACLLLPMVAPPPVEADGRRPVIVYSGPRYGYTLPGAHYYGTGYASWYPIYPGYNSPYVYSPGYYRPYYYGTAVYTSPGYYRSYYGPNYGGFYYSGPRVGVGVYWR